MQCTLTNQDGSTVAVMVTVTSVSGDQITLQIPRGTDGDARSVPVLNPCRGVHPAGQRSPRAVLTAPALFRQNAKNPRNR